MVAMGWDSNPRFPAYEAGDLATSLPRSINYYLSTFYKYYIIIFTKVQNFMKEGFWKLVGLPTLAEYVGLEPRLSIPNATCYHYTTYSISVLISSNYLLTLYKFKEGLSTAANFHF